MADCLQHQAAIAELEAADVAADTLAEQL